MKRSYETYSEVVELGSLLQVIKDKEDTINEIEKAYPSLKSSWLNFKGNKVIPLFIITNLVKEKKESKPFLTTLTIEDKLTYTGIICIREKEDVNELNSSNKNNLSVEEILYKIDNIRSRSNVPFTRLCTPATALLVLILGRNRQSEELKFNLGIKLPFSMKNASTLSYINTVLLKSEIRPSAFYTEECLSHIFVKSKETYEISKANKERSDKDLLAQPPIKDNKSCNKNNSKSSTTTDLLGGLKLHLEVLKSNYECSINMMEEKHKHINALQEAIKQHEKDSMTLLESIESIEKTIKIIQGLV